MSIEEQKKSLTERIAQQEQQARELNKSIGWNKKHLKLLEQEIEESKEKETSVEVLEKMNSTEDDKA